jgi:hypothetical protein
MVQPRRGELFQGPVPVASLEPGDQLRLAGTIGNIELFETSRIHTVMAFPGRPEYAANRNQTDWTLIGFKE